MQKSDQISCTVHEPIEPNYIYVALASLIDLGVAKGIQKATKNSAASNT
jgi:hypothetical protein